MLDKAAAKQLAGQYAEAVRNTLNPKSVILFGSYANGIPHECSDIDIAVVFDGLEDNWLDTAASLYCIRRKVSGAVNAGIEPHLMDEQYDRSGFLEHIKKTGELI